MYKLIRSLLTILGCALIVSLALEMTLRLKTYGLLALQPKRLNSMRLILNSDLVAPSEDFDIWFELKPNLDTWHKNTPFRTNSAGLRDREYALAKPADTVRIAVVGSSWTMATGVPIEDAWHSMIEQAANAQATTSNVEVLNFGVEMYGLGEMVATAKKRAMAFDPDIMIIAITGTTALFRWNEHQEKLVMPQQVNPVYDSLLLSKLDKLAGTELYADREWRPDVIDPYPERSLYVEQIERTVREVHAVTETRDIPLLVVWLGWRSLDRPVKELMEQLVAELNIVFVDANEPFLDGKERAYGDNSLYKPYYVSTRDRHANAAANKIIADTVFNTLNKQQLLNTDNNQN